MNEQSLSRAQEFAVMRAAHGAGVPVALPLYLCEDASILGAPFFIMEWAEGIAIGRKVVSAPELAAARAVLPAQMGEALARIHRLDPAPFSFLPRPAHAVSPAHTAVKQCEAVMDRLGSHTPVCACLLRWAALHAPVTDQSLFIHGDFRIGNLMIDTNGLTAVADWEFCHLGDPHEELGYLCMRDWRFGMGSLRMGGISDREAFLQIYEAHSGRTVARAAVDWWEILGNIRWGIICLAQADRHFSGLDPSVELASLGRRSVEMQHEALRGIAAYERNVR